MTLDFQTPKPHKQFTVLLWGADGVGKTPTILYLAKHFGPCAAIDADGGLVCYAHDNMDYLKVVETEDPIYARSQLEELGKAPGPFRMAAIDPLSTIYTNLINLVERHERSKRGYVSEFDSALHIGNWGPIKSRNRDLMRLIRWIGMPIICTAREDNLWKDEQIAGLRPAGDKGMGHEFTLNIRMTQTVPGGPRLALLVRDRLHRFPQRLEGAADDPFFVGKKIEELYADRFSAQPVAKEHCSEQVALEIHHLIRELGHSYKKIHARIRELGADSIEELTPEAAGEVLDGLRGQYQSKQETAKQQQTQTEQGAKA